MSSSINDAFRRRLPNWSSLIGREPASGRPKTIVGSLPYSTRRDSILYQEAVRKRRFNVYCFLLIPLAVFVIFAMLLFILLQAPFVNNTALQSLNLVRNSEGVGMPIDYSSMSGVFPQDFTLHDLRIIDPTGRTVNIGVARVHASLYHLIFHQRVKISKVRLYGASGAMGGGFIEDNTRYTKNEVEQSVVAFKHRSRHLDDLWPVLPGGLYMDDLKWYDVQIPGFNHTYTIAGHVKFKEHGGNFRITLNITGHELDMSFEMHGSSVPKTVQITVELRNSSLLCFKSGVDCWQPFDIGSIIPSQEGLLTSESRSDISLLINGHWSALLQSAFPSHHENFTSDLLSGSVVIKNKHVSAALQQISVAFLYDRDRTWQVQHATIRAPLMTVPRIEGSGSFNAETMEYSVAIDDRNLVVDGWSFDTHLFVNNSVGSWAVKLDDMASAGSLAIDADNMEVSTIIDTLCYGPDVCFSGATQVSYLKDSKAITANVEITDLTYGISSTFWLKPYSTDDDAHLYHLHVDATEPLFILRSLRIRDVVLRGDVYGIPSKPFGGLYVSFGEFVIGDQFFVMNNGSISAMHSEDAAQWIVNAVSSSDLHTDITFHVNGDNRQVSGAIEPFHAVMYNRYHVWTEKSTPVDYDFATRSLHFEVGLHANEDNPTRRSLNIMYHTAKMMVIISEESYLLDPLLLHNGFRTDGLLQGVVEIVDPSGAERALGSIDLCWSNGNVYDESNVAMAKEITGCVHGKPETGWSIDPPAHLTLIYPSIGATALRANITAERVNGSQALRLPVEAQIRLREPSETLEAAWINTQAEFVLRV